jgi:predicted nuclease with TOPRIM domain
MDDQTMFDLFDSLKREVQEVKQEVKQEIQPVKDALERIESRLTRHGGIIQGGTRQIARLITWSEEMDEMLAQRDGRIEELERRLSKLENGKQEK